MHDFRICPKRKKKVFQNKVKTLKGYEGLKIRDSLKTSKLVHFADGTQDEDSYASSSEFKGKRLEDLRIKNEQRELAQ